MAGKNIAEVQVAVDGVVSVAPTATTAPTDAATALPAGFVDLGYVSEDGVTETTNQATEQIRAWQNATVVRTVVTEGDVQLAFTLIQTSADVLAFYYGGTVSASDGSIVVDPTVERPRQALVLDIIDGEERIRVFAPEAQITEVGDIVYQSGAPIGYEVTVTCHYNDTLNGSVKKWFSALDTVV